jgi:hypothetical protein
MLGKSDLKAFREWEMFISFCRSAGFAVDPAETVMLDPSSSSPPPPDLQCNINGLPHFFELGEIIQQDIAWALSRLESQPITEPHMPLDTGLEPLEIILDKKLKKVYDPQARPLSLLLYYAYGPEFWRFLKPLVAQKAVELRSRFQASTFRSIYLYDAANQEILLDFSQCFGPVSS